MARDDLRMHDHGSHRLFSRGATPLCALLLAFAAAGCSATSATPADPAGASTAGMRETKDFSIEGYYVEACSCSAPCPCELVGPNMSCTGVGGYVFDKGSYGGEDLS